MSEEALQIAEEIRDMERKGERERYTQLNAEYQRLEKGTRPSSMNNAKK